ncbi:MAG: hypothetical protein J7639_13760 [Paenibacillaceae bacterium]|nr:hypothetical protein [Paenibacillaceae bacterium]
MANAIPVYADNQAAKGFGIGKTVELFRRFAYVEQSCVRALAGWFLRVPAWEAKIKLGYYLYAHAERAHELTGRLEEVRGGHRDANIEPALDRAGEEIVHAPDERGFMSGLAVVLRRQADVYRAYLAAANPAANATEIRLLHRLLADVEREIADIAAFGSAHPASAEEPGNAWGLYLGSLFDAAGGIAGSESRSGALLPRPGNERFDWTVPMTFDERIRGDEFGSYESKLALPLRERCIGEFEVYFNELYAAAIAASVIADSWRISAPRQYFMDIAHHFWDEVRHSEFGAIRLLEHGVVPDKANMLLFEQSRNMPLLHRYCYLTLGLEIFFMPRKSVRTRYYEEQGDVLSTLFADVDWSDEMNHVRYGKKWVDHFLQDDHRTVEDVQAEIAQYLENLNKHLPEGKKAPW